MSGTAYDISYDISVRRSLCRPPSFSAWGLSGVFSFLLLLSSFSPSFLSFFSFFSALRFGSLFAAARPKPSVFYRPPLLRPANRGSASRAAESRPAPRKVRPSRPRSTVSRLVQLYNAHMFLPSAGMRPRAERAWPVWSLFISFFVLFFSLLFISPCLLALPDGPCGHSSFGHHVPPDGWCWHRTPAAPPFVRRREWGE